MLGEGLRPSSQRPNSVGFAVAAVAQIALEQFCCVHKAVNLCKLLASQTQPPTVITATSTSLVGLPRVMTGMWVSLMNNSLPSASVIRTDML